VYRSSASGIASRYHRAHAPDLSPVTRMIAGRAGTQFFHVVVAAALEPVDRWSPKCRARLYEQIDRFRDPVGTVWVPLAQVQNHASISAKRLTSHPSQT
jgi:hypothetical protein